MARHQKESSAHTSSESGKTRKVDLQAMLDADAKEGRAVYFPPGRYRIDQTLLLTETPNAGITEVGKSKAA